VGDQKKKKNTIYGAVIKMQGGIVMKKNIQETTGRTNGGKGDSHVCRQRWDKKEQDYY